MLPYLQGYFFNYNYTSTSKYSCQIYDDQVGHFDSKDREGHSAVYSWYYIPTKVYDRRYRPAFY